MRKTSYGISLLFALLLISSHAYGQFSAPTFQKISKKKWSWFMKKYDDVKWTGRGLNRKTRIDDKQTNELRARMQAAFGDPTKTIGDLVNAPNFQPGKAIEFEYWFVVNDSIPMMVLDIDGPFGKGLVYGGASEYIGLMPQIKRTFAIKLMSVDSLANYDDYFYSPERKKWFRAAYKNGKYSTKQIDTPKGMGIHYDY